MNKAFLPCLLALGAASLLLTSLKLPLWQMRMEAPQDRDEEALKVAVYPNTLRGDLGEIQVLNQYIGVHVPAELPQLKWLPSVLIAAGALGVIGALAPRAARGRALVAVPVLLCVALVGAAAQAQWQMHAIGHHRDQKTALVGVKNFTPPLLGRAKIAQFAVESSFGLGAWLVGAAVGLQFAGAFLSRRGGAATPERGFGEAQPHKKSARGLAQSKSWRWFHGFGWARSVLDCGGPLPLLDRRTMPRSTGTVPRTQPRSEIFGRLK